MGLQLIFVVETDKRCKSDWIYIKDTIERFYQYDQTQIKLSPVYMGGKGNYKNKEREISKLISQYASTSKTNQSKIIYCFDCDEYDSLQEDFDFLNTARKYCDDQGADFVWFCKDIERVYLGKKVANNQKKAEAAKFKAKKLINCVDMDSLLADSYRANTSNIMNILDKYLERK